VSEPKRIILTFRDGEIVIHTIYQCKDGPNPHTKRRLRKSRISPTGGLRKL
jgi:hypothetical protein